MAIAEHPTTPQKGAHLVPNGPMQYLRQHHLGRLRPARQPGPCRYPFIRTLPRTPQGGTPRERLPRQAVRAPLTAASPQHYRRRRRQPGDLPPFSSSPHRRRREPLGEPRTSAEPCVPSRHHHPCQSPAGRPRPAHGCHSPRWPASTRCSRASPASVSAHSSFDDAGSGGCVRQTDHHRLRPRHRTDARVRCPTTGRRPRHHRRCPRNHSRRGRFQSCRSPFSTFALVAGRRALTPDPPIGERGWRAVTCRCPSCVEDWSCEGSIGNHTEGHLTDASIS